MAKLSDFESELENGIINQIQGFVPDATLKKGKKYDSWDTITFSRENIGKLEFVIKKNFVKRADTGGFLSVHIDSGKPPSMYYCDPKDYIKHIFLDVNNLSDIRVNIWIEMIIHKKTDFGGYSIINKVTWDLKNITFNPHINAVKYYGLDEVSKILHDFIFTPGNIGRRFRKNNQQIILNDVLQDFKTWTEVKKIKKHDKDPLNTRILDFIKELWKKEKTGCKAVDDIFPKFTTRAEKTGQTSSLRLGNVDISLKDGELYFWFFDGSTASHRISIPNFNDPKFDMDKIIELSREIKRRMVNIEASKKLLIQTIKDFKM